MNSSVAGRFNHAAATYDSNADLQHEIADEVMEQIRLRYTGKLPKKILELGCGTGYVTARLAEVFPKAAITAVDISTGMLDIARKNLANCQAVTFLESDIAGLELNEQFELIVSSSSLHWITPLEAGFQTVKRHLAPKGLYVTALMTAQTFKELKEARQHVAPAKPYPVSLPTVDAVVATVLGVSLTTKGYKKINTQTLHPSATQFLRSIHDQGVTGQTETSTLLTARELAALIEYYDAHFSVKGGDVFATYEVVITAGTFASK